VPQRRASQPLSVLLVINTYKDRPNRSALQTLASQLISLECAAFLFSRAPVLDLWAVVAPCRVKSGAVSRTTRKATKSLWLIAEMQPVVDGVEREFQAVRDAQLIKDIVYMILDRLLADKQLLGYIFVLISPRH
jgi:hypothetical protein